MRLRTLCEIAVSLVPTVIFAAPRNLGELIGSFLKLINPILGLLTGLAVVYFVWGIVQYIKNSGDESAAKKGKSTMLYGMFALFILFSFWGIVQFIYNDIFR
jgi:hypothetical protein